MSVKRWKKREAPKVRGKDESLYSREITMQSVALNGTQTAEESDAIRASLSCANPEQNVRQNLERIKKVAAGYLRKQKFNAETEHEPRTVAWHASEAIWHADISLKEAERSKTWSAIHAAMLAIEAFDAFGIQASEIERHALAKRAQHRNTEQAEITEQRRNAYRRFRFAQDGSAARKKTAAKTKAAALCGCSIRAIERAFKAIEENCP